MEWLIENKEWVFSGIGVFALTLIVTVLRRKGNSYKQSQKGGDYSINIQSGKDTNIK